MTSAEGKIHRATLARRRAEQRWREAMIEAEQDAGLSHERIAKFAGVSPSRVGQILLAERRKRLGVVRGR